MPVNPSNPQPNSPIIGRFAPSPTGPLHLGSLMTAVASYLQVKSQAGKWLLRIEDIDTPRQMPDAAERIIEALAAHGLQADGEIVYQSQRLPLYQQALHQLAEQLYACRCSRKQIAASANVKQGIDGLVYPGNCRDLQLSHAQHALRIRVPEQAIIFDDLLMGHQTQQLAQQLGDFVLRRADGIFTYQLAVVVDDALQGVTHILRGSDLLDSTARQIFLQQSLNYPTPSYCHIPVIVDDKGEKLSKQSLAPAIDNQYASQNIYRVLQLLGQQPPALLASASLSDIWQWALAHWQISLIPAQRSVTLPKQWRQAIC